MVDVADVAMKSCDVDVKQHSGNDDAGDAANRIHNCDQRSAEVKFTHPALPVPLRLEQRGAKSVGFVSGTSSVMWPVAYNTSRWLCERPELVRGRTVVELGAGLGLVGATAAGLGAASVVLTDCDNALPLLERNRDLLAKDGVSANVSVACMSWGETADEAALLGREDIQEGFDVIVCSDVLIGGFDTSKLCSTGLALLSRRPDACWLMGFEFRDDWETVGNFIASVEDAGLICTHVKLSADESKPAEDSDSESDSEMFLYTFRWRSK